MGNWLPKLTYLCFNTQPRGGGCTPRRDCVFCNEVSTHSRAEAAARRHIDYIKLVYVSTHSRAEAAAEPMEPNQSGDAFQHTAARRRLHIFIMVKIVAI